MNIKINSQSILNKLNNSIISSPKVREKCYNKAYKIYLNSKNRMIKDFDNHPVTLELIGGMGDPFGFPNISDTLDGYGNLYAFLGFENGKDPIEPLRELLDDGTTFKPTTRRGNIFYYKVSLPTKEQINIATPMDWEYGNSWAEGIEKGISNLSYFLNKEGIGRSGGGVQIESQINDDLNFHTVPYLTKIFNDFKNNLL